MATLFTPVAERLLRTTDAGELVEALSAASDSPAPLLFEGIDFAAIRRRLTGVRVNAAALLLKSAWEAMDLGHGFIGPEHLLLGLAHQEGVRGVMEDAGFDFLTARVRLAQLVGSVTPDVRGSVVRMAWAKVRRWALLSARRN